MKSPLRAFVDSDVIISSLISQKGAAYMLVNKEGIQKFISTISQKELEIVTDRLSLNKNHLKIVINQKLKVVQLKENKKTEKYVFDINDSHIIDGAIASKSNYLLTYNIKHYKIEKIKKDLGIIIMRPAEFLQFLRSN